MQTNSSGSSRAGGVGTTMSLLLLATLLTVAATMFSYQQLKPEIERDLTARVATSLQGTSISNFSVDGQDVILTGSVASRAASEAAEKSAADVYGVSRVINNLTVNGQAVADAATENETDTIAENIPAGDARINASKEPSAPLVVDSQDKTTPATLTVVVKGDKVSAQGIVSDDNTIDRLNNALTGKFGRANVKNELSSFEGSKTPEWTDGMVAMIDQLDGLRDPVLKVTGDDLLIGGKVVSEEIRKVKLATADRILGTELNIIDNMVVQPLQEVPDAQGVTTAAAITDQTDQAEPVSSSTSKTPASISIKSFNQQVTISGFVADETDAEALRNGVGNLFGQTTFIDEMEIDDSIAKADWIDDALSVTSEIRDVSDFSIKVSNEQMLLGGTTIDREQGRDLSIAATEIAGDKLDVLNNFFIDSNITDLEGDLLAQSLKQELDALPTKNIVFNKNSITLTESAQEVLDDVAAAILGYSDLVVEVAGHTDASGDAVKNLKLSKDRATAVRDYLLEKNVPANRLSPIGYGETSPIGDNETDNGRAANRRIEFNL